MHFARSSFIGKYDKMQHTSQMLVWFVYPGVKYIELEWLLSHEIDAKMNKIVDIFFMYSGGVVLDIGEYALWAAFKMYL